MKNQYTIDLRKKCGIADSVGYLGTLTCNGTRYAAAVWVEKDDFRLDIADTAEMQKYISQGSFESEKEYRLNATIYSDGRVFGDMNQRRNEIRRFGDDAKEIISVAKDAVEEFDRSRAIEIARDAKAGHSNQTKDDLEL